MKLIKVKNGYINADMIESYAVVEHDGYCDIVAYAPSYTDDCCRYELGKCNDETTAYARLNTLAEELAYEKFDIFDMMDIFKSDGSDYDDPT